MSNAAHNDRMFDVRTDLVLRVLFVQFSAADGSSDTVMGINVAKGKIKNRKRRKSITGDNYSEKSVVGE
jgi:hypothetical protein